MQKISQLICLTVFFIFVVTSCMAWTVVNQTGIDDPLHHFVSKRAADCPPCCRDNCGASYVCGAVGCGCVAAGYRRRCRDSGPDCSCVGGVCVDAPCSNCA